MVCFLAMPNASALCEGREARHFYQEGGTNMNLINALFPTQQNRKGNICFSFYFILRQTLFSASEEILSKKWKGLGPILML